VVDAARIPVVVAVGQAIERSDVVGAADLAERAVAIALDEAPLLRPVIDRVSLVSPLAPSGRSLATDLAGRLGLAPSRCETTTVGGNTPQWLVTRAAADVAAGRLRATVIAGAEAMRSAKAGGVARPRPAGEERPAPDPVIGDDRPGVGPNETAVGLILPVHLYAMIESAIAGRAGASDPVEHRVALGRLLAPFTEVAARHPYAWFSDVRTADEIATPSPDNRVVAEPYTKRMAAFLNVDQGAAVVVCSLAEAERAGVAGGAVFVWSGADCNDVWFPSARPDLASSPGIAAAAGAALDGAGVGVDDVTLFDLYSCFPSAVELAVDALGIALDDARGLTLTGGLPYFGGPGNDYVTHSIATAVERLRDGGGDGLALVTGLGWYLTKHSVGVYGTAPPPLGFRRGDTAAAQAAIDASALDVVASVDAADGVDGPDGAGGRAVVDASTVLYQGDEVGGAPVVATLDDGRRVVAAADPVELPALAGRSLVGARIRVRGTTYRVEEA
jgi:acetyl-CoA C-acetyltransferase